MYIVIISQKVEVYNEKMKDASSYLGKYSSYVSERFRRTRSNEFVVNGKVVSMNE